MADASVEEHFPYGKPLIGRVRGGFVVGDDLRIEHPLLKSAAAVPFSGIAAVAREDDAGPEVDLPVLRRELRHLDLSSGAAAGTRVAVVLRPPASVGPFRYGAERGLAITRKERQRGVDVDVVQARVEDADGLVAALGRKGVAQASMAAAVLLVSEEATGPELDARLRERAVGRRRTWLILAGMGLATSALLGVRLALAGDEDLSSAARVAAAGPGWALVLAALALPFLPRRGRWRSLSAPWRLAGILALLAAPLVGPLVAIAAARTLVGPTYVLVLGLPGGLAGAWLVILAARVPSGGQAAGHPSPVPLAAPQGSGRTRLVLSMSVVGVIVLAWTASGEPGRPQDLALVRRAVVTEADLPAGWRESFPPAVYRGSDLRGHICGTPEALVPPLTAGYDREFSRYFPGGSERAHLVVAVFATESEAVAARELASVDRPAYAPCTRRSVAESALMGFAHAHAGTTTFRRSELRGVDVPGVLDEFATAILYDDGSIGTVHTAMVRLRVGRLIVRMPIIAYGGEPYGEADLAAIVRPVVRKVASADS